MAPDSTDAIHPLQTIDDRSAAWPVTPIGNAWSRKYFGGPFYVFAAPPDRPAVSLVFVQSRNGNTGAADPAELGGGLTDKCLLYEGLSRVVADAVLAGASTVGRHVFFTIKHPELVALRLSLGFPRHPKQMVLSNDGHVDLSSHVFTTPDVPVLLLAGAECRRIVAPQIRDRPWITIVPLANSLAETFAALRHDHGIGRISAVGGRITATSLVDAGLVQDIYLTTSAIDAGEPDTPWYAGERKPGLEVIVQKREVTSRSPLLFEHLALR